MDVNVKVAVRCRPMSTKEIARGCINIVNIVNNSITVKGTENNSEDKTFTFDYAFDGNSTQQKVYQDLGQPIVSQALDGFNGTIFAYGQTGSGKTHSMLGNDEHKGIIPQLNDELWQRIPEKIKKLQGDRVGDDAQSKIDAKFLVTVSFLEVYNEDIKDLLNPSDKKLKIHESPELGIYVEGLAELVVKDASDVLRLIYQGNAVRHVGATQMNDQSSRSHSVFTIKVEQKIVTELSESRQRQQMIKAKINLVDLAGSERASKTQATGQTLKEGANINKSLLTLGNVINQLSEGMKKNKVIPYRESKLTRLLQESLGGNAATIMIASISPADYNYAETVSTLKYANRAKSIENAVVRNEDSSERMIRDLQHQIEELKAMLKNAANSQANPTLTGPQQVQNSTMTKELEEKLKEMEQLQLNTWEEKEKLSKQLELEREQNMNQVITQMMQSVKEQKVLHMKNIKRLTNEKALLTKNIKDWKEENSQLKHDLDSNIAKYQQLQVQFDAFSTINEEDEIKDEQGNEIRLEREKEAEVIANEMIPLLTKIEHDRLAYTEKRDAINRAKNRLQKIDTEITEERAELVTTAGVLQQNDKLREQIQEEERHKMQMELEKELAVAREKLEEEKLIARENINLQVKQEMESLKTEIKMLKNSLKLEQSKNTECLQRIQALEEYSESLESRLADSEVAQEASQEEIQRLTEQLQQNESKMSALVTDNANKTQELLVLQENLLKSQEQLTSSHQKQLEEAKFDLFSTLMNTFQEERKVLEAKHHQTQRLLAQATKDLMHLAQRNQELESALNQAIYYEPSIV